MITELAVPEKKEIEAQLMTLSEKALQIKVTDDKTLLIADNLRADCMAMRRTITDFFKPLKEAAHKAHKALTTAEADELNKIVPGEKHLQDEMNTYRMEQKRIRDAEEAKLRKEAEAREEADRLERAAEIEREAAALKASGQEEAAAEVQQQAEQVLATPAYVPPPRMVPAPKTKNAMKMIVDRERLQGIADALNERKIVNPPNIPGVRFYQTWQVEILQPSSVPENYRKAS
jgi:hypothetical protein